MDLQDFKEESLYFQQDENPAVDELLKLAAENYGPDSESILQQAVTIAPKNLSALIGCYRFYFYQNRHQDGIDIAHKILGVVAERIGFPEDWKEVDMIYLTNGVQHSFTLVRMYFFALKAAGYLNLRLGDFAQGIAMLEKVVSLDNENRIGAKDILETLNQHSADVLHFPTNYMKGDHYATH